MSISYNAADMRADLGQATVDAPAIKNSLRLEPGRGIGRSGAVMLPPRLADEWM